MKIRNLVLGIAAGMTLLGAASFVNAETITSADGVISIETPSDAWTQKKDSKALLEISDGKNSITIDHRSNGEALPAQEVANDTNPDVYTSLISTKNEVFSVRGLAVDNVDLQTVIKTAGTIKILKFDTNTAVTPAKAQETKKAETTQKKEEPAKQSGTDSAPSVLVVFDEDGMSVELHYDAAFDVYRDANGNAFLMMEYPVVYQPDTNSYWAADRNFWDTHDADEMDYSAYQTLAHADEERQFVLYNEGGSSVTVVENIETGNCVGLDGLTYQPMGSGTYYQPDTNTYWNTDPSYWNNHDADDMDYDKYVDDLATTDDDADGAVEEEFVDEAAEEDVVDYADEAAEENYDDYAGEENLADEAD